MPESRDEPSKIGAPQPGEAYAQAIRYAMTLGFNFENACLKAKEQAKLMPPEHQSLVATAIAAVRAELDAKKDS